MLDVKPEVLVAGFVGLAATVEDLARRNISNWIPVVALAGGIACQVASKGWMGIPVALGGAICGFLVFLVFYWLGGMGGGDVKLMAGFGALLGYWKLLEAALWASAVGGLIALGVIGWSTIRDVWRSSRGQKRGPDPTHIPYAPAIVLGVWLAMVPK
jgi:prepilin peptidase CpaA